MYTHIHTTEWILNKEHSTDKINYFINRVDDRILAEYKVSKGYEYYICSDFQMKSGCLGMYIGCVTKNGETYPDVMVYDHDKQTEKTVSLNDEEYF